MKVFNVIFKGHVEIFKGGVVIFEGRVVIFDLKFDLGTPHI